ncbi:hypothetical protein ODR29_23975, partial [Escherichia coli]|nr:hypothetical protein [Escherichia coli]
PGPVFHTIVSIKNDGHYFCRAGGNRPDGLNEPVTEDQYRINLALNNLTDKRYRTAHETIPAAGFNAAIGFVWNF